jgi:hypothetical protein
MDSDKDIRIELTECHVRARLEEGQQTAVVTLNPDGSRLAVVTGDGTIVWDLHMGSSGGPPTPTPTPART